MIGSLRPRETDRLLDAPRQLADEHDHLALLLLHGSRAQRREHVGSDWDLGLLASGPIDVAGLHAAISRSVGTDDVDLTDLSRASALLRFEAARHGRCISERQPGAHAAFVLEATQFWCDAESVIRPSQAAVLARL